MWTLIAKTVSCGGSRAAERWRSWPSAARKTARRRRGSSAAPTITLTGPGTLHLQCQTDTYDEANYGATWTDACEGGPFAVTNITYDPPTGVNTEVEGTYTVLYNVTDACGNAATEVIRTVIVEEPAPTCNAPPRP